MEEFTEIRRFVSVDLLHQVTEILDDKNIEYRIDDTSYAFDITFTKSQVNIEYILKVKRDEQNKVEELLNTNLSSDLQTDDYYLDSFSDDELIEVISNPSEWSDFDTKYARNLLTKKGVEINETEISTARDKRIEEQKAGLRAKPVMVISGYLFSIMGGVIGLIIAVSLRYSKKEITGGQKVFYYDLKSRLHGATMITIFFIWALIYAILFLVSLFM
ncbi:MAG: hypothetical protein WCK34_01860 [Bacteroidota bacterium]